MIREEHEMYAKLRAEFENETEQPYLNTELYLKWLEKRTIDKMMQEQVNGDDTGESGLHLQNVSQQRELLLAYEKFGCTEEYWKDDGKKFANEQISAFLSQ